MADRVVLLGHDHPGIGEATYDLLDGGHAAAALSAGSDPALASKKHAVNSPNEDAVVVRTQRGRSLLAVADGHHGQEASHHLIAALADPQLDVPTSPLQLRAQIGKLVPEPGRVPHRAGTTLITCVVDRRLRRGFGRSFGDSSAMLLGPDGPRLISRPDHRYVRPARPETLGVDAGDPFIIAAGPGDLLLVFTDGVNECCYGQPERSVQPTHLQDAWDLARGDVARFCERVLRLALNGVGGQPGGEDNVAFACIALGA